MHASPAPMRALTLSLLVTLATVSCGRSATPPATAALPTTGALPAPTATRTATPVPPRPAATPTACLEPVEALPGTATGPLRIVYWAQGRLWQWEEESGVAVDLATGDWAELPLIEARRGDSGDWTELAFSPDGRHIAALEGLQLSLVDLRQHTKVPLTDRIDRRRWGAFAWSEDGMHLAYSIVPERGAPPELWLVHADGSGARRILARPAGEAGAFAGLAWLPGTCNIVYQFMPDGNAATLRAEYLVVSAAGGLPQMLFTNGLGLALSPDGQIISFVRDLEGEEERGNWIVVLSY